MPYTMKLEAAFSILFTFHLHLTAFSLGSLPESISRRDLVHVLCSGELPVQWEPVLLMMVPRPQVGPSRLSLSCDFHEAFASSFFHELSRTRAGVESAFGEHRSAQRSKKTPRRRIGQASMPAHSIFQKLTQPNQTYSIQKEKMFICIYV